jgi:uncharacterized RDD family membrane protein YckC
MIDLSKSCLKCDHLKRNDKSEMNCEITNLIVHFEDTCDLFEMNKEMLERKNKDEKEFRDKIKFNFAPANKRMGNYVIDILAIIFIELITGAFLIVFQGKDSAIFSLLFNDQIGKICFTLFLTIFYYTLFEALTGKSIGKYITKTKVITLRGKKPGWAVILLRSVCRLIPLDQISFILDSDAGWHDSLSKTIVINE